MAQLTKVFIAEFNLQEPSARAGGTRVSVETQQRNIAHAAQDVAPGACEQRKWGSGYRVRVKMASGR